MKLLSIFNSKSSGEYPVSARHLLGFTLVFFFSLILLETINARYFVVPHSQYIKKYEKLLERKDDIEVLFIGDSRFDDGLDASLIGPRSYNLSFGGLNSIQSYYILKKIVPELTALKVVVLSYGGHAFRGTITNRFPRAYFFNKFIEYWDLMKVKGPYVLIHKFKGWTLFDPVTGKRFFVDNMVRYFFRKLDALPPKERPSALNATTTLNEKVTLRRAKFHFMDQNLYDADLIHYFTRQLKFLEQNGIAAVLLEMPVSKAYASVADKFVSRPIMDQKLIHQERNAERIKHYFNFFNLYHDQDEYFRKDGDHLNIQGRKVFSRFLGKQLSKM